MTGSEKGIETGRHIWRLKNIKSGVWTFAHECHNIPKSDTHTHLILFLSSLYINKEWFKKKGSTFGNGNTSFDGNILASTICAPLWCTRAICSNLPYWKKTEHHSLWVYNPWLLIKPPQVNDVRQKRARAGTMYCSCAHKVSVCDVQFSVGYWGNWRALSGCLCERGKVGWGAFSGLCFESRGSESND